VVKTLSLTGARNTWAIAWDGSALWVRITDTNLNDVFERVDPQSGAVLKSFKEPTAAFVENGTLVWDGTALQGFSGGSSPAYVGTAYRISVDGALLGSTPFNTPANYYGLCTAMALSGTHRWLSCSGSTIEAKFATFSDNGFDQLLAEPSPAPQVGALVWGMAITEDAVYAFDAGGRTLYALDPTTANVKQRWSMSSPDESIPVPDSGHGMIGMAFDGTGFWMAEFSKNVLHKFVLP
jgi:outer membrane protein assembly factor BamB